MKVKHSNISVVCCYFSFLLGSLVVIGWIIDSPYLIQTVQSFAPMQFNTALGFVLGGIGFFLVNNSRLKTAYFTGLILLTTGSLTLLQYVLDVDLGIDQLLFLHHITVNTSHPGRMAPNTAICLILTSFSLLAISYPKTMVFQQRISLSGIAGGLVSTFGIIAFVGYLTNLEPAYGWGDHTQMALHTAVGFSVLGFGITAFAWKNEESKSFGLPRWFPALISTGEITFSLMYSEALNLDKKTYLSSFVLSSGILLALVTNLLIFLFRKHKALLNKQLIRHRKKFQSIKSRFRTIREHEKIKIAREIHDDLGQSLTALKLELNNLQEDFPKNHQTLQNEIRGMLILVDEAIRSIQRIAIDLRPPILNELPFLDALCLQIELFQKRTKIKCEIDISPDCDQIDSKLAWTLYRIVQESLTNIARHSKASQACVYLSKNNRLVILKIIDNGIGITKDQIANSGSVGISGIRERIEILDGELSISGVPSMGTTLEIRIPLNQS